jgi:hypothetical protein
MNYNNGKIYQIVCNITGEVYIGSCITTLVKRLYQHKHKTNKCSSKQIIDRGDYVIVLIEEFPCENKSELFKRERYHFDLIPNINRNRPYVSEGERIEYDRERCKAYNASHIEEMKAHYESNRVERLTQMKAYNEVNAVAIATRKKAHYEINKEAIITRNTKYNEINKEAISKRRKASYQATKTANTQVNNLPN